MNPTNLPYNQQCSYSKLIQKTCHHLKTHNLKEAYYPSYGDAVKWLTGTAMMRDTWKIRKHKPTNTDTDQTTGILVHVISVLNVTRYAAQVKRQIK